MKLLQEFLEEFLQKLCKLLESFLRQFIPGFHFPGINSGNLRKKTSEDILNDEIFETTTKRIPGGSLEGISTNPAVWGKIKKQLDAELKK